jgi:hypothetical protein
VEGALTMDIAWTAHPARRQPEQIALIAAIVLVTTSVVLVTLESAWLALLAAVILLASVAQFLFPTRYRLSDAGVHEQSLLRRKFRAWRDLRRVQVGLGAALVSPFARPSWMDRYRGIMLYLDGSDRDAVIARLRDRIRVADTAP